MIKPEFLVFSLLLLVSCAPNSPQDFEQEGEAWRRKLAFELQEIHNRKELCEAVPKIKKRFTELVDLIVAAKAYQLKHSDSFITEGATSSSNELLMSELQRIYRIEGGRETMESAQKEALIRLDRITHE